jgi:hypothetical protein
MKLADIKAHRQKLDSGTLVGDIPLPGFEGVRLCVRSMRNNDFIKLETKLVRGLSSGRRLDISPEQAQSIEDECLKQTVLMGWDGIPDAFTAETVDGIFADPDFGDTFREAIRWCAQAAASAAAKALETDVKN